MSRVPDIPALTEKDMEMIRDIGLKYGLKLILLHGSYADGTAKPESDLDIAILGHKQITREEFVKIHNDFSEDFYDNHDIDLDLKTLHRADPLFCYQVAKNSRLLFGTHRITTTSFATHTLPISIAKICSCLKENSCTNFSSI